MDKRLAGLTLVVVASVIGVGCSRPKPAPIVPPPAAESKPDPTPPAQTAAPAEQAAPPIQAETKPEQPAASAAKLPVILQQVLDAGWKLSALKGLPPLEHPDDQSAELKYDGGALRFYQDSQDSFYALVVDHTRPTYQEFQALASGPNFMAASQGKYTAVLRIAPVSQSTRAELASREWTQAELTARFGPPTRRVHNHGIGTYTVTYVPQGLEFEEAKQLKLTEASAEAIWQGELESLAEGPGQIDATLAKGKDSPDGRFQAGYFNGGVYWSQAIVVREAGKSERLYFADYFIQGYFWLDNRRVVYGEIQMGSSYLFHIIDAVTERVESPVKVEGQVTAFGPAGTNAIWYTTQDGVRHQVNVPAP